MRRILFESLLRRPLTEARPAPDDGMLAELAANLDRAARKRLGRSLSMLDRSVEDIKAGRTRPAKAAIREIADGLSLKLER